MAPSSNDSRHAQKRKACRAAERARSFGRRTWRRALELRSGPSAEALDERPAIETTAGRASRLQSVSRRLRALGPYVAIGVMVPGGLLIAPVLWVYRRASRRGRKEST